MVTLAEVKTLLNEAERILVLAGAGMSAELAVPTYWTGPNAKYASTVSEHGYTELEHADGNLWKRDPKAQQAFFQKRYTHLNTVNVLQPGSPYQRLMDFINRRQIPVMAATSNVDSFFLKAGIPEENIYEIHGTYRNSQCLKEPGNHGIFPTDDSGITTCPTCGGTTRPNVMFFNDFAFNPTNLYKQKRAFDDFRETMQTNQDVVIEVGAGNTVPTIRNLSVIMSGRYNMPVIRINPNLVSGVDGIAGMIPKSRTAPFVHIKAPVTSAFGMLFKPEPVLV